MRPDHGFVEANGLRLHYLEWGDPARPPALLVHATGFLAALWQPVAEALAPHYRVLAYDARGHGDSDKPPSGYHWQVLLDDLRGFLDALALERVFVIAHSASSVAALQLAANQPRFVSRLVAIEPILFAPDATNRRDERRSGLAEGARRRRMVWPSRDDLYRTYRERPAFGKWRDDILRLYVEEGTFARADGQVELKCPGEIEAQMYENSGTLDAWPLLPKIACPVLVMRGEGTDPSLFRSAGLIAEAVPGARLFTIEGAGHFSVMEKPDVIAEQVLAFAGQAVPK